MKRRPVYKWDCFTDHAIENEKIIARLSYIDPKTITTRPTRKKNGELLNGWTTIKALGWNKNGETRP